MSGLSGDEARAMARMQADLGIHRLEELAVDGPETQPRALTAAPHRQGGMGRTNAPSNRWQEAIAAGMFDDDAAAATKNLDPLDNGQAHRRRKIQPQALQGVQAPSRNWTRTYDPSQPGYNRNNSKRKALKQKTDPNMDGTVVSSHGILLVGNTTVKRFDPPTRTSSSNPQLVSRVQSTAAPQRQVPPLVGKENEATGVGYRQGPQTRAPGLQPNGGKVGGRSTPGLETQAPKSLPVLSTTGSNGDTAPRGQSQSSKSGLAPHMRIRKDAVLPETSNAQATVTGLPKESTTAVVSKENEHHLDAAISEPRKVVYEVELMTKPSGSDQKYPCRLVIYELTARPVAIWKLVAVGLGVMWGDIRAVLEPHPIGSKLFFRRRDIDSNRVKSTELLFNDIDEAKVVAAEVKFRISQFNQSSEPFFMETYKNSAPDVVGNVASSHDGAYRNLPKPDISEDKKHKDEQPKLETLKLETSRHVQDAIIGPEPNIGPNNVEPSLPNVVDAKGQSDKPGCTSDDDLIDFSDDLVEAKNTKDEAAVQQSQQVPGFDKLTGQGQRNVERTTRQLLWGVMERFPNISALSGIISGDDLSDDSRRLYVQLLSNIDDVTQEFHCLCLAYPSVPMVQHAFNAALFSLMRRAEFLSFPPSQQALLLASVHDLVDQQGRITPPAEEVSALRPAGTSYPKPVEQFNQDITNWGRKHPEAKSQDVSKNASTGASFSSNLFASDWQQPQVTPQGNDVSTSGWEIARAVLRDGEDSPTQNSSLSSRGDGVKQDSMSGSELEIDANGNLRENRPSSGASSTINKLVSQLQSFSIRTDSS